MVLNDLVVEYLLLLEPTHQLLHFFHVIYVLDALLLLVLRLLIPKLVEQFLVVNPLILQLVVELLNLALNV